MGSKILSKHERKRKKEMFPNFFVPKQKKKFVTVIKSEAGIFADLESHC